MNQDDVITPEIIDIQPATTKAALAKTAWDSLPLVYKTADNLQTIREACNHSGTEFLSLCQREGLRPDFSVIVVNHTENHYHTTHPGMDMAELARALQQAQQPLIEALRAQHTMPAPVHQGLTLEEVWARMQAQQPAYQPTYPPQPYYPPEHPDINIWVDAPDVYNYNDLHPSISAHATSHSEQDNGYGGSWALWFGVVWLAVFGLLVAGSTASD